MPKEQKYEAAMRQLEDIAAKMENGELDIDSLSEQLKTAQKLIKQCKDKLTKTDEDIRKYSAVRIDSASRCLLFVLIISNLRQIVAGLFYYYYFCLRLGEHIPAMKKKRIKT